MRLPWARRRPAGSAPAGVEGRPSPACGCRPQSNRLPGRPGCSEARPQTHRSWPKTLRTPPAWPTSHARPHHRPRCERIALPNFPTCRGLSSAPSRPHPALSELQLGRTVCELQHKIVSEAGDLLDQTRQLGSAASCNRKDVTRREAHIQVYFELPAQLTSSSNLLAPLAL